jgi:hypothetical protein
MQSPRQIRSVLCRRQGDHDLATGHVHRLIYFLGVLLRLCVADTVSHATIRDTTELCDPHRTSSFHRVTYPAITNTVNSKKQILENGAPICARSRVSSLNQVFFFEIYIFFIRAAAYGVATLETIVRNLPIVNGKESILTQTPGLSQSLDHPARRKRLGLRSTHRYNLDFGNFH